MIDRTCIRPLRWIGLLALLSPPLLARAQLGGDEASVVADAQALGTISVRQSVGALTRYELKVGRTTIHEYAAASGQIYAIRFSGGATPNLDQLLGNYLPAFRANESRDRRSSVVNTPTLRAQLHGHPGAVSGLLWLPPLLPAGVAAEGLQ